MKQLGLFFLLLLSLAWAAPIEEVEVRGGDTVLQALARIALPFGVGDEPGDLEAARKAVLDTGYFKDARVRLEGNKLIVEVVPNPPVESVAVESKVFPQATLVRFLETQFAIGPEVTYNPKKAREAADGLAQAYRQQGFPFFPVVGVKAEEGSKGIKLSFGVEENPELKKVELGEVSYVSRERLQAIFNSVPQDGRFDFQRYMDAVNQANQLYNAAGYRGSGVDNEQTQLQEGTLKVALRELKIAEIRAGDLDVSSLGLKAGDPFNYDKLLDGVNALSRQLERSIEPQLELTPTGVRITLRQGAERYGPIKEVRVEGNTAFPTQKLLERIRLKPGDIYNPALAQEDFGRILALYREAGYELVAQPQIRFQDGVYTQIIQEIRIEGYEINAGENPRTQRETILRYLPQPGSLYSVPALRSGLTSIVRSGILAEPPQVSLKQGSAPEKVVVVLGLKEARTLQFLPSLGWSSLEGWSGSLRLADTNLWGLLHNGSLDLSFGQNDAGDPLSFSLSYQIPWLYADFADFKEVNTSVGISIYTVPSPNNPLLDANNSKTYWEFTERKTGFRIGISRPLSKDLQNLRLGLGLRYEYVIPKLETGNAPQSCDDPNASSSNCTNLSEDEARALLEKPYGTFRLEGSASYSQINNPRFPTQGYSADLQSAFGISTTQGESAKTFVPFSITGKTYFALDDVGRQVLALRLSTGIVLGNPPESQRFYLGGAVDDVSTLRGYDPRTLGGIYLVSGGLEYRYDFGLSPGGGTNIYAVAFTDFGSAWNPGDAFGLKLGYGLGLVVELDVLGALLPPFRVEYGFSPDNPGGKFYFRFGSWF
ncbi:BamA/OMP85 family outer membrane protein [Calidithermus roseus]|uniref:Outer membrane protein assembly factor BamA n=1 Tax=Calidithermus roseus TaxID=1644118 RepID=A0A399F1L0_9DEIN|nr:BamA/TamA family outer membrane protein [Calidithermus roseus]RIH89880.1 Outer membrane protein assembly factor BamA [Calidithermus roseus]